MILVFVDETGDSNINSYLGLSLCLINHSHYKKIKSGFQKALKEGGWDTSIEFKGSYLFSASKGDTAVAIDERIEIANAILDLNIAARNARMRFYYASRTDVSDQTKAYLETLPLLLKKAVSKADARRGKDLVSVYCDQRSDIRPKDIETAISPVLDDAGYSLVEGVTMPTSGFETVGILFADIVGYLNSRIETISYDSELFEDVSRAELERNGKFKKLQSSQELIAKIKELTKFEVVGSA